MPKAVVVDEAFNWGRREIRPSIPWEDTIIYEAHVKGLTQKRRKFRQTCAELMAGCLRLR